jgi:hypothetical protein
MYAHHDPISHDRRHHIAISTIVSSDSGSDTEALIHKDKKNDFNSAQSHRMTGEGLVDKAIAIERKVSHGIGGAGNVRT